MVDKGLKDPCHAHTWTYLPMLEDVGQSIGFVLRWESREIQRGVMETGFL